MKIENTIFLLLDMQERLIPAMADGKRVENKTGILLKGLNELNIPVIYTEQYPEGLGKTVSSLLECLENAKYFSKREFSAFPVIEKEILKLKSEGKTTVVVSGVETHICVYQTVRDLIENGFEVFIPFETIMSRDVLNYENGVNLLKSLGANIVNVETVLFDLIKTSKHDSFKIISKLIK